MLCAVRKAVQNCQYEDADKRDRLCAAIVDALKGTKTMKFAACAHDVNTTLRFTFLHIAMGGL